MSFWGEKNCMITDFRFRRPGLCREEKQQSYYKKSLKSNEKPVQACTSTHRLQKELMGNTVPCGQHFCVADVELLLLLSVFLTTIYFGASLQELLSRPRRVGSKLWSARFVKTSQFFLHFDLQCNVGEPSSWPSSQSLLWRQSWWSCLGSGRTPPGSSSQPGLLACCIARTSLPAPAGIHTSLRQLPSLRTCMATWGRNKKTLKSLYYIFTV